MSDKAPESVTMSDLAALLADKSAALPSIKFHRDKPCELAIINALIMCEKNDGKITASHLIHSIVCQISSLTSLICARIEHTLEIEATRQSARAVAQVAAQESAVLAILKSAEKILEDALHLLGDLEDQTFDGTVSDAFLESIGLNQEQLADFRQRCLRTRHF